MTGAVAQLLSIACALLVLVLASRYVNNVARVIFIAQAGYWAMSYLARPIVLLWVQPKPQFGDSMADPRLAVMGYPYGIARVLPPVTFGLWFYTLIVVAYALWSRRRPVSNSDIRTDPNFITTLMICYVLGTIARIAAYLAGTTGAAGDTTSGHPMVEFATRLAAVGALGTIVFLRSPSAPRTLAIVGVMVISEVMWAVVIESKTPVMAAALAIAIRFALTGWNRAKIAGILTITIVGVGAFGQLQALKESASSRALGAILNASYPASVRPFLSPLRRFDLLEAATDGYYMAGRSWLSPGQVFAYSWRNLIPSQLLGATKVQSGTAWAQQVRGSSLDMSTVSVSLAEGNINEGYVIAGRVGIAVSVLFTFFLLLASARALRGNSVLMRAGLGLSPFELPVLFERGILGSTEALGKALQLAILTWMIHLCVGEYRRRRKLSGDSASTADYKKNHDDELKEQAGTVRWD